MTSDCPPIAIIRTLPAFYGDPKHEACINYRAALARIAANAEECCSFALPTKPKQDFLHVYIVIQNKVTQRFQFVAFRAGGAFKLWDSTVRHAAAWAVCSGPVSTPPHPIEKRGFRGFQYIHEPLW